MTRRHWFAVGVAVASMLAALLPPLWIRTTGEVVTLEVQPIDPLSIFRGNYVDLRYGLDDDLEREAAELATDSVYIVYADERPARGLRVSAERPELRAGEFCLKGEWRGELRFPALEQVFVTPERGLRLERSLTDHLAEVAVTGSCRAVIIGLVAR